MITADAAFAAPEERLPRYSASAVDSELLHELCSAITTREADTERIAALYRNSSFPLRPWRVALVLYAPGEKRILTSRESSASRLALIAALSALLRHKRCGTLAAKAFRLQIDFIETEPVPTDFFGIGLEERGERHFEPGVDGLQFRTSDRVTHLFLPGDAFVRSIMGMRQLREYLYSIHGEASIRDARFWRFRSASFISSASVPTWQRLYRGYPLVGAISRQKIEGALRLAIDHIRRTQEGDGRFLYYYDAALDSRRDHEHPKRDPETNPYYNIVRHGGGALTCLYAEKYLKGGAHYEVVRRAIEFYLPHVRQYDCEGRVAAYIFSERKAKLGGSGIALYVLAVYELMTGDRRYRTLADAIAWHLLHQITDSGEFIYYNIYLDRPISEAENSNYFSFYYPGEAVCGLAKYLHLAEAGQRVLYAEKLHGALEFLINVRPQTRADQFTAVPSDAWLMMGIMELWDFEEMRRAAYAEFVFGDAQAMIDHLYKVTDAPWPDCAGAFYYQFGDYPYADGARCEGLLGAYELARKLGDDERARTIWRAIKLAAWAVMHLVNTEDAIYFARNPALSLGGIRFKYTRQWFRIDTIQHVASFYAKLLPYWEDEESRGEVENAPGDVK